ncbi:hypothetical protein EDD16DRAFT_1663179 [Pisolithus croceorrhizus]|nr:hypothetical protein EDD16DRAFT_1663179 [Pisolithus croceorrhizus]
MIFSPSFQDTSRRKKNVCASRMFQLWRLCVAFSCCSFTSSSLSLAKDFFLRHSRRLPTPPSFNSFCACGGVLTWTAVFLFF